MRRWGIRARVLFLALVPSALILATLVAYFTTVRISDVDTQLAQRGAALARQLAPGAEFALFAADRAALQRMADAAAKEADVANVTITDAQGQVVARSGSVPAAPDTVRFTEPVMATRLGVADVPEQMTSSAPRRVGEISVEMSRAGSHAHREALVLAGVGLGMLGILLALVLSVSIGASVTRPVRRLADAMRILSARGSVDLLPEEDGGELRTLARGFNEMAARLQANARDMEVRIERATRALTAQKDAAEQATEAKSRFIAAASHDLRQPLHAIGLFTGPCSAGHGRPISSPWFAISPVRLRPWRGCSTACSIFHGSTRVPSSPSRARSRSSGCSRSCTSNSPTPRRTKGCACACAP